MNVITTLGYAVMAFAITACATTEQAKNRRDEALFKKDTQAAELFSRGEAAARAGDMTRAEQYLVAAGKAGSNERAVIQRLLLVCVADQRYPAAAEHADNYLRRHPADTEVRFASASIYAAIGDGARAERELARVVNEKPDWAEAHYTLATVLREQSASALGADRQYREYLRLAPSGAYAEAARGYLLKAVP